MDSNVQAMATGVINAAALASDAVNAIADGLLDRADAIEVGMTPRQSFRLNTAASAGKLSGAATTTVVIRNAVADSKNRITATVDSNGITGQSVFVYAATTGHKFVAKTA